MLEEFIKGRDDLWLAVEKKTTDAALEVIFHLRGKGDYRLHWGLARQRAGSWQSPPEFLWPAETQPFGQQAVQTPFTGGNGERAIALRLSPEVQASFLVFDLFCPTTKRWENNHGKDFYLPLAELEANQPAPTELLEFELGQSRIVFKKLFALDSGDELAAAVTQTEGGFKLILLTNVAGPLALHWGVAQRSRGQWQLPAEAIRPAHTKLCDEVSVGTPFAEGPGVCRLEFALPETAAPPGISFVLHQTGTKQWLKHRGQNLFIPISQPTGSTTPLSALAERIVEGEMGEHGWTLMHRFNLCHELIEEAGDAREAWATLFVWLRYSAIRQLDWQRNYNTKPRELSHAQDRLTARLASAFGQQPANRDLIRAMFACLGRGGEGQRIRDEILQIMHRHHIKEVGGTWMEQWHQKLHNNTTPDDVVICEAYLAFLQSNGNPDRYHETLLAGGVTKERMASFERPINTPPEWHPHLRDGLLHDFGNYLNLLKSVHSGTDLFTAINTGGHLLRGAEREALGFIHHHFQQAHVSTSELAGKITFVRRQLHQQLADGQDAGRVKELLYLDLALEQALRTVVERAIHSRFSGEELLGLIQLTLENLLLLPDGEELAQCQREVGRLPAAGRFTTDWALHAKAALDRLRRAIEATIDRTYQLLQPKAELLGKAFQADAWVVNLFSEEFVRGQPVFLLSMLLHHLDPILRKSAKLGDWQVISPSQAVGRVHVVQSFRAVQGQRFEQPTVIVAEQVHGDEEPPENVRAVITPSSVDLVSHIAVRARNASLLFATCFGSAVFERLQAMQGRVVELKVTATGDVLFTEAAPVADGNTAQKPARAPAKFTRAKPSLEVLALPEFSRGHVGGKSVHLKELAGKLPDWIHTPRSVALPFGVFDAVLTAEVNRPVESKYRELLAALPQGPETNLAELRQCLLELQLPSSLPSELRRGLPAFGDESTAATRIKQVWASKWNDRAYFSREARGFPHDAVQMAVLIQEVVQAEYAFVIHTVNPFNRNRDELYAEVVLGLGETLVGNYPGRALSFVCAKQDGKPAVLAYPSKNVGLFGGGLIFRSDSNAEDLEGYAGAGLYDSVLLTPPREVTLDYTSDKLVWDEAFRANLLRQITELGVAVEAAFGSPQDIEGAITGGKYYVVQTRPQVGLHDEERQGV